MSIIQDCLSYLMCKKWKDGYECARYYYISTHKLSECQDCHYQSSITARTLMYKSKLTFTNWFWVIYLEAYDKRGKSALSLSQILDLHYLTARRLLRDIRDAIRERDSLYMLSGLVEMDVLTSAPLAKARMDEGK